MCFLASMDEKEALMSQLDSVQKELQELEENVSSHQSEVWAWGSIALVGLATGDVSGLSLQHMIECGGMEALALAVSKCHLRDMPVVLNAIRLLAMDSTASAASLTSMRIMLEPVLHILATLADDRRIVLYSFCVLQVLTSDPQSHVVVQKNLSAVFDSLSRHEGDEAIQMLGLQMVSNLVEDGTVYDYGKGSDHLQVQQKPFYEKVFPAGWKVRLGQSGAVVAAVRVFRVFHGKQLMQSIAARNLWKLAQAAPENRRLILQEGGIQATIDAMLRHLPVHKTQWRSSNEGVACKSIAHAVSFGAGASRASRVELLSNGVQVFWKMAWNEPDIQRQIIEQGGLWVIIQAMAAYQEEAVIQTLACGALLAIVRTHNDFNRNAVLRSEGLAAVRSAAHCHGSSSGVQWMCAPVEALLNPPKASTQGVIGQQASPDSSMSLRQTSATQQTASKQTRITADQRHVLSKLNVLQASKDWRGEVAMESEVREVLAAVQAVDLHSAAFVYSVLGNAHYSLGHISKAIGYHTQRLAIAKEAEDRAGEGLAYGNLGNAYQSLGDLDKAIEFLMQHLAIATEVGDRAGKCRAYANLGATYQLLGESDKAVEHHMQQLAIANEDGDRAGQGYAYSNLGSAHYSLGNVLLALKHHTQHLSIAKEVGDEAGEGAAYANLGYMHQSLGDASKAIEYHMQCLANAKKVGDLAREGLTFGNLGVAYQSLGDFSKAVECHMRCLAIAKKMGDRTGEGKAYRYLGTAFDSLGDTKKAVEYLKQHLAIAKEVGEGSGLAHGQSGIAHRLDRDTDQEIRKAVEYRKQHQANANECARRNRGQQQDDALCRAIDAIEQLRNEATALFRKLDKNQNGALQVYEMLDAVATKDRKRSTTFDLNDFMALIDTDGDGGITLMELRAHRHAGQSDSRGQDSFSEKLENDEEDSIEEELAQATGLILNELEMKHFTQLDVDMSQSLTWSEFRASRLLNSGFTGPDSRGRIQPKDPADLFAKADVDGDGILVRQEFVFLTDNNQFKEI